MNHNIHWLSEDKRVILCKIDLIDNKDNFHIILHDLYQQIEAQSEMINAVIWYAIPTSHKDIENYTIRLDENHPNNLQQIIFVFTDADRMQIESQFLSHFEEQVTSQNLSSIFLTSIEEAISNLGLDLSVIDAL